jgi:hypothetical protein
MEISFKVKELDKSIKTFSYYKSSDVKKDTIIKYEKLISFLLRVKKRRITTQRINQRARARA